VWRPEAYYIHSKPSLLNISKRNQVNVPFETNILHELFHVCQMEEGFPHTATNPGLDVVYDRVGSAVISSVLDLNVDFRLKSHGYSSEYFYNQRIKQANKQLDKGLFFQSEIDFIINTVYLVNMQLSFPGEPMHQLLLRFQKADPGIANATHEISAHISRIGYNNPESSFRSLVFIFDAFNLWQSHHLIFQSKKFFSLPDVRLSYPDIHTLEHYSRLQG